MKNKRLEDLESAAGGRGGGPDEVIHKIQMDEDDNITVVIIADGEKMTQAEFNRRWPNYKDDEFEVKVNWSE